MVLDITDDDAPARIDDELLAREVIRENGRIVCVSSMSGIAGNAGQANHATDVAETIAWFASPAAGGVNGNVVRVGAQGVIGA